MQTLTDNEGMIKGDNADTEKEKLIKRENADTHKQSENDEK